MTANTDISGILVAAHELKAPLCIVRQLALALDFATDETARERLQRDLVNVSERALRQVEDLTKISRLGDTEFASEPVSVRGVCDGVLREMRPFFHSQHRGLGAKYTNKARLAVTNRDLLASIVHNFCTNAVRYSEIESESQLSIQDYQGKIRVSVRDFGPALPVEVAQALKAGRLCQPTAIAMRPDSSGLGLYIAARFAQSIHAEIGATRHRDGVSFFVDLPVSRQAELAL